jgi:hypothetical protein
MLRTLSRDIHYRTYKAGFLAISKNPEQTSCLENRRLLNVTSYSFNGYRAERDGGDGYG